jgi:hypothetical protein
LSRTDHTGRFKTFREFMNLGREPEPIYLDGGITHPPTALGLSISGEVANKHSFKLEVPMASFHKDGPVADW